MSEPIVTKDYDIRKDDFVNVGEASTKVKTLLKQVGFDGAIIRRIAIAMYEGEINMVIHAEGGVATVEIYDDKIKIILKDVGPGIKDISLAMKEGYSTASDHARSLGFGAGMGLANMKKNTDEMEISTELGVGTTVEMVVIVN